MGRRCAVKPSDYDGRGIDPPYPTLAEDNAMLVEDNKQLRTRLAATEALLKKIGVACETNITDQNEICREWLQEVKETLNEI
jgi:hypothetical protein